jgi:hypothetical protein
MDTLVLAVLFANAKRQDTEYKKTARLGDGYQQNSFTHKSDRVIWQGTAMFVTTAALTASVNALNNYAGGTPFLWRFSDEDALKPFTCKSFTVQKLSVETWSLSVVFQEYEDV